MPRVIPIASARGFWGSDVPRTRGDHITQKPPAEAGGMPRSTPQTARVATARPVMARVIPVASARGFWGVTRAPTPPARASPTPKAPGGSRWDAAIHHP